MPNFTIGQTQHPDKDALFFARKGPQGATVPPRFSTGISALETGPFSRDGVVSFGMRGGIYSHSAVTEIVSGMVRLPKIAEAGELREGFFTGAEITFYRADPTTKQFQPVGAPRTVVNSLNNGGWQFNLFGGSANGYMIPDGGATVFSLGFEAINRPEFQHWYGVRPVYADNTAGDWVFSNAVMSPIDADLGTKPAADAYGEIDPNFDKDTVYNTGPTAGMAISATVTGGLAEITLTPPTDTTGVVGYQPMRFWYDPNIHTEIDLYQLNDNTGIAAGDLAILRYVMPFDPERDEFNTPRGYSLNDTTRTIWERNSSAIAFKTGTITSQRTAEGYRHVTMEADAKRQMTRIIFGTGPFYYNNEIGEAFNFTLRARVVSGSCTFVVDGSASSDLGPTVLPVDDVMREHTVPFTTDTLATSGYDLMITAGPEGCEIELDTAGIFFTENGFNEISSSVVDDLVAFAPESLRDHRPAKTNELEYINSDWFFTAGGQSNSMHMHFALCKMVQEATGKPCGPWIEPNFTWPKADFHALMEIICATYDPEVDTPQSKPWAYKRFAAGQVEPWIEIFPRILIETPANEPWNNTTTFYAIPPNLTNCADTGVTAAYLSNMMVEWMMESPYWSVLYSKLEIILAGRSQATVDSYTQSHMDNFRTDIAPPKVTVVANHYGPGVGWEDSTNAQQLTPNTPDTFAACHVVSRKWKPYFDNYIAACDVAGFKYGSYEANAGMPFNASDQYAQDTMVGRLAFSNAVAASFIYARARGYGDLAWFAYNPAGKNWASHISLERGRASKLAWKWLSLLNTQMHGPIRRIDPSNRLISKTTEVIEGGQPVLANDTDAYEIDIDDGGFGFVLHNLRIPSQGSDAALAETDPATTRSRIRIPRGYSSATLWKPANTAWDANNGTIETTADLDLVSSSVDISSGFIDVDVPAGNIFMFKLVA